MKNTSRTAALLLLTLMAGCWPRSGADIILTNATVLSLNDYLPPSSAVAIVDGKILAVGRNDEIRALATWRTTKIDLNGATVVPGLTDSHFHFRGFGEFNDQVLLWGTTSAKDAAVRMAKRAKSVKEGSWIIGRGWDQNDWDEQVFPTRQVLDRLLPDHPVMLKRVDGHAIWVNSRALELAGISDTTATPDGGAIIKDEAGFPTGVFIDNATDLFEDTLPEPTRAEIRRWLVTAASLCNQLGFTEIHDPGVDSLTIAVLKELADEGQLTIRYYGMLNGDEPDLLKAYFAVGPLLKYKGMITVRAVKYYADGALGSRGAALLADYSDDPGNRGLLVTEPQRLAELIERAISSGFQPAVHAIGNRANRSVLDIYEQALTKAKDADLRLRIEHAQVVSLKDIKRFGKLGVIAALQPSHATSDMYWAEDRVGATRIKGAYAWRKFLDAGAHITSGSDTPVEMAGALLQLYAARTRQDTTGWPQDGWYADQRLSGLEALRSMTSWAAYAAFEDSSRGMILPGFDADVTVLSGNPALDEPAQLLDMEILLTIVDGKIVWKNKRALKAQLKK